MDKLRLNLDDLEVDSFKAGPESENGEGTVHGQGSQLICADTEECNTGADDSCVNTCVETRVPVCYTRKCDLTDELCLYTEGC